MKYRLTIALAGIAACLAATTARAEDEAGVPYWASIRAEVVNMRVGPGEDYRINWVYHRKHLPLKVLRMKEGWRLVRDPDGTVGWIMARFLTRDRGGHVQGKGPADMRDKADDSSDLRWRVQPGVTGRLGDCSDGWCRFDVDGRVGYVRQERLWGAGEP